MKPNILLITADDMHWQSPGCFGGAVPHITPNIDRLASEGVCFRQAHVTIGVCMPSRSVLMTGRYPHRNGARGFEPIHDHIASLPEELKKAGYKVGILGKVTHIKPVEKFGWDMNHDYAEVGLGRDPALYYQYTKGFIDEATEADRPFFLMANSHDPHRPFSGSEGEQGFGERLKKVATPSRKYGPEEASVPGFLPELEDVKREVSDYQSSVRRCDDTVGGILRALKESGREENTLVMFLSDNGMAFPFAKTNCYLHSTKTPWIVKWPGKANPGAEDTAHFISGIDFMPTILEAAGLPLPPEMDGTTFLPLLKGESQGDRDHVFTVFHKTAKRREYEMRCVQDGRYGYIFNAWADGQTEFINESQAGLTMSAMKKAAETDPAIAERVRLFLYRVPEELYDFSTDPDALNNLAEVPQYASVLKGMRTRLFDWMKDKDDELREVFAHKVTSTQA